MNNLNLLIGNYEIPKSLVTTYSITFSFLGLSSLKLEHKTMELMTGKQRE